MKEDIVTDILHRAEQAVRDYVQRPEFAQMLSEILNSGGGMEQRLADSLSEQIRAQDKLVRKHWGGTEPYVPQRAPEHVAAKIAAIEVLQKTGKVSEASSRTGISRRAIYRLLEKRAIR
jgi:transcriptional regulator of acetoin/glycerol metabolism